MTPPASGERRNHTDGPSVVRQGGSNWFVLVALLSAPGLMFLVTGIGELARGDYFPHYIPPRWWWRFARLSAAAGLSSPPATIAAVVVAVVASRRAARPWRLGMRIIAGCAVLGSLWIWGVMGLFGVG